MNSLEDILLNHEGRLAHKIAHYIPIYEKHLSRFRNTEFNLLEIGVWKGGSLEIWKKYFGKGARVVGIDINPSCMKFQSEDVHVEIGNQSSVEFLEDLNSKYGPFSVVIDDGSHQMSDVKETFEYLFRKLDSSGVYIVEDMCCAYWKEYGGGKSVSDNFVEFSKSFIHDINVEHWREPDDIDTRKVKKIRDIGLNSIHYYNSMVVFEKSFPVKFKHIKAGGKGVS